MSAWVAMALIRPLASNRGARTAPRASSALVEAARYARPGIEGDINAVAVGGLAAALTVWVLDLTWSLLTELVRQTRAAPVERTWDRRAPGETVALDSAPAAGSVEQY